MQRLMRKVIKPTTKYRQAVVAIKDVSFDTLISEATKTYGHSPCAFERIGLYLKYNEKMVSKIKKKGEESYIDQVKGMTVDGIVDFLAESGYKTPAVAIHRNSWIRWATPNHKYQSNNMYYETWVLVRDRMNELLAKTDRSIGDFTNKPTYSPENLRSLRENLGLDVNSMAEIIGVASGTVIEELENPDAAINTRGMGYGDWLMVLDRVKAALNLKLEHGSDYLTS